MSFDDQKKSVTVKKEAGGTEAWLADFPNLSLVVADLHRSLLHRGSAALATVDSYKFQQRLVQMVTVDSVKVSVRVDKEKEVVVTLDDDAALPMIDQKSIRSLANEGADGNIGEGAATANDDPLVAKNLLNLSRISISRNSTPSTVGTAATTAKKGAKQRAAPAATATRPVSTTKTPPARTAHKRAATPAETAPSPVVQTPDAAKRRRNATLPPPVFGPNWSPEDRPQAGSSKEPDTPRTPFGDITPNAIQKIMRDNNLTEEQLVAFFASKKSSGGSHKKVGGSQKKAEGSKKKAKKTSASFSSPEGPTPTKKTIRCEVCDLAGRPADFPAGSVYKRHMKNHTE